MNTTQLECFVAVAEHLNFSRASEELKMTQPAVSHQIRSLETELETVLFKRTSKSVTLTEEGILFLADAQLILKTSLLAKERLGRHEHFVSFEVGCHNHMELNLLPPIFAELTEEFPLLHPSIQLVPFPSLLGLIENRQIHAAFGVKEGQNKSSLYFRELCSAPVACVCSPEHPLARYETLTKNSFQGALSSAPRARSPILSLLSRTAFSQSCRLNSASSPKMWRAHSLWRKPGSGTRCTLTSWRQGSTT